MQGWLEVLDGGIGNSIQDRGRFGFRHMGIAVSGWMNLWLARCANALVGNPRDAACIEIRAAGPRLCVLIGPVRVALAGNVNAEVRRGEGEKAKTEKVSDFRQAMRGLIAEAERTTARQRYKGLGEMNPEQL